MPQKLLCWMLILLCLCYAQHSTGHSTGGVQDPNAIVDKLLEGNQRFIKSTFARPNMGKPRREETVRDGQKPMATILSCSDSRVPIEHIFDVGIGDVFVVRVAGNVAEKSQIGSIEYAAGHLGTPLIMVLGHTKCGAVNAAVQNAPASRSLRSILNNIQPAVQRARAQNGALPSEELVDKSIVENVWQSIEDLFKASAEIRALATANKVKVVGALYDIESGAVKLLGVHFRQQQLMRNPHK